MGRSVPGTVRSSRAGLSQGERPFLCGYCEGHRYKVIGRLRQHIEDHHPEMLDEWRNETGFLK